MSRTCVVTTDKDFVEHVLHGCWDVWVPRFRECFAHGGGEFRLGGSRVQFGKVVCSVIGRPCSWHTWRRAVHDPEVLGPDAVHGYGM
jgi:hypothetical protein